MGWIYSVIYLSLSFFVSVQITQTIFTVCFLFCFLLFAFCFLFLKKKLDSYFSLLPSATWCWCCGDDILIFWDVQEGVGKVILFCCGPCGL